MWSGLSACAMSAAPSMATPTVATEPATASSANVGFLEAPPDLRDEENALRVPVRVKQRHLRLAALRATDVAGRDLLPLSRPQKEQILPRLQLAVRAARQLRGGECQPADGVARAPRHLGAAVE